MDKDGEDEGIPSTVSSRKVSSYSIASNTSS